MRKGFFAKSTRVDANAAASSDGWMDAIEQSAQAFVTHQQDARWNLANFATVARCYRDQGGRRPRVCYVGGSITEQQKGWRPRVHTWLEQNAAGAATEAGLATSCGFQSVRAFLGNVGSTVLCFLVKEWIIDHEPDLIFIDGIINDGDTLLESGSCQSIRRSLEGIVRQIRQALPKADIVFVYHYIREDTDVKKRTGTQAWADGLLDREAIDIYHRRVPMLYDQVANMYGIPSINLVSFFKYYSKSHAAKKTLDKMFRDDCHHTEIGSQCLARILSTFLKPLLQKHSLPKLHTLPNALDALHWTGGKVMQVSECNVEFLKGFQRQSHTRLDRDPLSGKPMHWWLLDPNDKLSIRFHGLALLTHVGPDSGILKCTVKGPDENLTFEKLLFDKWAYYYRLSVVVLFSDLALGDYQVEVELLPSPPDRSIAKKEVPGGVQGDLKLWLSYALVIGDTWASASRTISMSGCNLDETPRRLSDLSSMTAFRYGDDSTKRAKDVVFGSVDTL